MLQHRAKANAKAIFELFILSDPKYQVILAFTFAFACCERSQRPIYARAEPKVKIFFVVCPFFPLTFFAFARFDQK